MTDGERWTRGVLADLRDARYRPTAWTAFLAASFRRSADTVSDRPRERRQTLTLGAAGLAAWAVVAILGHLTLAGAGAAWWVLVMAMVWWHLGMLERPDGSRVDGLGRANIVSLARVAAVPALPAVDSTALAIGLVALGALDVIDGWLARNRGEETRLGRWLDGASDTVILTVAAVLAGRTGTLPWWIALVVLVRVALPWLTVTACYFVRATAPATDRYISARIPGAVLMTGVVLALLGWSVGAPLAAAGAIGAIATFVVSVVRRP